MDIKVPLRKGGSKVEKALKAIPHDGEFHRLFEMGWTSAEQTARGLNAPGSPWVFGYTHEGQGGNVVSVLWAKYESQFDNP